MRAIWAELFPPYKVKYGSVEALLCPQPFPSTARWLKMRNLARLGYRVQQRISGALVRPRME